MSEAQRRVPGTILRGPDGTLYFVPDSALEQFRIFDNHIERIEQLIGSADYAADEDGEEINEDAVDFSASTEPEAAAGDVAHHDTPIGAVYATLTITDTPVEAGIAFDIICSAIAADRATE